MAPCMHKKKEKKKREVFSKVVSVVIFTFEPNLAQKRLRALKPAGKKHLIDGTNTHHYTVPNKINLFFT